MNTSMTMEEKLKAMAKQLYEMSMTNQELKTRNEYLRKQLGSNMKQRKSFRKIVNELGRIMEVKRKLAMRYLSLKMMYHSKG